LAFCFGAVAAKVEMHCRAVPTEMEKGKKEAEARAKALEQAGEYGLGLPGDLPNFVLFITTEYGVLRSDGRKKFLLVIPN
jgi:hypothetical protein